MLVVAALLGLAVPVKGQQTTGDTELQLQGSLFLGGSNDMGSVSAVIGRFFTDRQEVGITVGGTFNTDGKFGGFGGPNYRYNFSTGKIVRYLGAAVGSTFGNFGGSTTTIATGEGGVRYFVDRKTAFTAEATKTYFFKQKEFDKGLTITFGFSHLWGR